MAYGLKVWNSGFRGTFIHQEFPACTKKWLAMGRLSLKLNEAQTNEYLGSIRVSGQVMV